MNGLHASDQVVVMEVSQIIMYQYFPLLVLFVFIVK